MLSSSVGYFIAQNLPNNLSIRVVTNSIIIAEVLRPKDNISVILLGGEMDQKGNCSDAIAVETVKKLRFDKCFVTSAFISASFGLSIQRTQAISFFNTIMDSAKKVIGLYPKEKIGFDSIVSICPINRLDIIITDLDTSEDDLLAFSEADIDILIIDKPVE